MKGLPASHRALLCWPLIWGLFAILLISGCKVGPDYEPPQTKVPENWTESSNIEHTHETVSSAMEDPNLSKWWSQLGDEQLTWLIEQSFESNLEMQLARARLNEAIALRQGALAELFPSMDLEADYTHRRASRYSSDSNDSDGLSGSLSQSISNLSGLGSPTANVRLGNSSASITWPQPGSGDTVPEISASHSRSFSSESSFQRDRNSYAAVFGATWEIDIWGAIQRSVEAADAEIGASMADYHSVQVALAAEVARNYILLRSLQRLVEVTRSNLTIQQETLNSIRSRFAASLATGTDVLQAEIQLRRTEAELPPLEAGVKAAIFRLSVLLGHSPDHLLDRLTEVGPLPNHPNLINAGLPSELLRRRPDIRAAEQRLASETAMIGVEVAELYPRVSLTGSFGPQSASSRNFLKADSLTWSFGPAVQWRLAEFGRIVSSIHAQQERQSQALTIYYQVVLQALEQVETGMANYAAQRRRSETLAQVNAVNQRAFELAKSEYAVGMISFLSVLDTQSSLFSTQTELIRTRQQALVELVNLYEALGGGWPQDTVSQDTVRENTVSGDTAHEDRLSENTIPQESRASS